MSASYLQYCPEGWQAVPKTVTPEMAEAYASDAYDTAQQCHDAVLGAAPHPDDADEAINSNPTTNLDRLKAQWKADNLEDTESWREAAAHYARNADFYRGIVIQIGELFGEGARTSDDGSVQDDVLALKVPELVEALVAELGRYSMSAGHADQRRAESRAVRKALGFGEDVDDVSPQDLLNAITHRDLLQRAEELDALAEHFLVGESHKHFIKQRAHQIRQQAKGL